MITFILFLSLLFQMLAIYFSLRLIRITGQSLAWGLIASAIALMGLRRVIDLTDFFVTGHLITGGLIAELVALVISILMAFGIARVTPIFKEIHSIADQLRDSEEKFRTLVENAPLGIFRSTAEGRFLEVNPAMARICGFASPEAMLHEVGNIGEQLYVNSEDRRRIIAKLMNTDNDIAQSLIHARKRDGSEFIAHISLKTVHGSEDTPIIFDGIVEDVTAKQQVEAEKEKLHTQLTQAQKLEAIGRLAGGIAHDFNNMLGVIIAYSNLAKPFVSSDQKLKHYLQEISGAADRSFALTRRLLTFARQQSAKTEIIDINKAVEDILKMLECMISEEITLDWFPGKKTWSTQADPSQLDQVLVNLCVNASHAIDGKGCITIETCNIEFDIDFCSHHPSAKLGDYVCLRVSDNGCGMDTETLEKIFEPFYSTKEKDHGTGLGLSTVYGIVQQSEGYMDVESEPGMGTSFSIYLPRHSVVAEKKGDEAKVDPFISGHENILLVDDEPAILEAARTILNECGYTVMHSPSPEEAIRMAIDHDVEIHMLITDIVMPDMSGRDLAERILSIHPNSRCLYMSGYTDDIITSQSILDEGSYFIQKPFTIEGLTAKVREVLDT